MGKIAAKWSAKSGAHHWLMQRFTALLLVPLTFWVLSSLYGHMLGADQHAIHDFIARPFSMVMLALFIGAGFYHAYLGLQVVIEDYIHCKKLKYAALFTVAAACLLMAVVGWVALIIIGIE